MYIYDLRLLLRFIAVFVENKNSLHTKLSVMMREAKSSTSLLLSERSYNFFAEKTDTYEMYVLFDVSSGEGEGKSIREKTNDLLRSVQLKCSDLRLDAD